MTERVLVLGGYGMLGSAVAAAGRRVGYDVRVSGSGYDVAGYSSMSSLRNHLRPDYVINCAGIIPIRVGERAPVEMVRANAYGPWVVRAAFPHTNIIHVSTDCVFSGRTPGLKCDSDIADPADLYGRSKLMGEVPDTVVVRTSFIGMEHGLARWFFNLKADARVRGWIRAYWSGATVYDVADALVRRLDATPGVYHLAAPTITKYQLLLSLREIFDKNVTIDVDTHTEINRGLYPSDGWTLERNLEALAESMAA